MDASVPGVIQTTVVPLILSYIPAIVTLVVAWITVSQLYFKRKDDTVNNINDAKRRSSVESGSQSKADSKSKPAGQQNSSPQPVSKTKKKQASGGGEKWSSRDVKQNFSHEWLLTSLKGHTGAILDMDFSANGKFLATCADGDEVDSYLGPGNRRVAELKFSFGHLVLAKPLIQIESKRGMSVAYISDFNQVEIDRAVFVWNTKNWKEKEHKYVRYNVEYDHASLINWSPDSKAFVYLRSHDNVLEVCKLAKRNDGWIQSVSKAVTYQQGHKDETIGLGISSNGKYIMTCSSGTDLVLWDFKGSEFARVDTYLMNNIAAKVSPCGTFVAASGFAPDVKVWQVIFAKTGEFKSISRAFELTGHSSGVYDFAFNADSSLVATVSKDGSWRLYNIKIEYQQGEEPHLIKTGKYKTDGNKACIALSPDGNVIALACGSMLSLVNAVTGLVDKEIYNIYSGSITKVLFDAAGQYVLTAGDRHVRVFHNVTGQKANIQVWKSKLTESGLSLATKERLTKNIANSEAFLNQMK